MLEIIALMVAGAWIGKEHPVGITIAFGVFLAVLTILVINPPLGALALLVVLGTLLFMVFLPFIIGWVLGIAFIYFFVIGLAKLVGG